MGWFGTKEDKDISKEEQAAAKERMRKRQEEGMSNVYGLGGTKANKRSEVLREFQEIHKKK